jgi:hypothetical protein
MNTYRLNKADIRQRRESLLQTLTQVRYEQIFGAEEKDKFLKSWGLLDVTLDRFRQIFG